MQNKVSQKGKIKCSILTHICGIWIERREGEMENGKFKSVLHPFLIFDAGCPSFLALKYRPGRQWPDNAVSPSTYDPIFQSSNCLLNAKMENLYFAFSLKQTISILCEQVNFRDGFVFLSVFYSHLRSPLHTQQWYHITE